MSTSKTKQTLRANQAADKTTAACVRAYLTAYASSASILYVKSVAKACKASWATVVAVARALGLEINTSQGGARGAFVYGISKGVRT